MACDGSSTLSSQNLHTQNTSSVILREREREKEEVTSVFE